MTEPRKLWHIDEALAALDKAEYAVWQTSDPQGRQRTILSVNYEEAAVISTALKYYIEKFEDTFGTED